jgi:negative regulator of replication initiation
VPDEVLEHIDADARESGISRSEYLRRMLASSATRSGKVTEDDLTRFAETFADLADPEVMRGAWS